MRKIHTQSKAWLENPLSAGLFAMLAVGCWLSSSWGHVRCSRGMRSGQCVLNYADPAVHLWGAEWVSFELRQLVEAKVLPHPAQGSHPLELMSSAIAPRLPALCTVRVSSEAVRVGGDQRADDAEALYPLTIVGHLSAAEQCNQLTQFAAGNGGRAVTVGGSFVWCPRLLAALLLLAAIVCGCPSKCSAGAALLTSYLTAQGRYRRRSRRGAEEDEEFEWTKARVQRLMLHAASVPKGTRGRWPQVSELIDPLCTAAVAEAKFKSMEQAQRKGSATRQPTKSTLPVGPAAPQVVTEGASKIVTSCEPAAAWTAQEQKVLEWSLKQIGKDESDRWDKVAALVKERTGRSKKDVIRRCKEIIKLTRSKQTN